MAFHIPQAAVALAEEISLGDLIRITEHENNRMGIIRMISYCRSHLMTKPGKTDEEKNLLLDLIELTNEIGQERFDQAFAKDRERLAARKTPQLPIASKTINPNRRRADIVRLQRTGR